VLEGKIGIRARLQACRINLEISRLQPPPMSIPHRHSDPGNVFLRERTFFVTSSICGKRSLLQSDRAAGLFVLVLRDYLMQGRYRLHEFVVMPDHFHLLVTVDGGMTIERAVQFIKGGFAFKAARELGFHAPVWQKGFSEIRVLDVESFHNFAKYIWNNPVKRGLVERAEEYVYSSARDRALLLEPPQRLKPHEMWRYGTPEGVP
jgi:putative transposase